MKGHKMNVYLNNALLGNAFHEIPNRIVPAIGMYHQLQSSTNLAINLCVNKISSAPSIVKIPIL